MSCTMTTTSSTGTTRTQADAGATDPRSALSALADLQRTKVAAEDRANAAADKAFETLRAAYNESQKANEILAQRLSEAMAQIGTLAAKVDAIELTAAAEKDATSACVSALTSLLEKQSRETADLKTTLAATQAQLNETSTALLDFLRNSSIDRRNRSWLTLRDFLNRNSAPSNMI